jgi:hypothetical protein
LPVVVYLNPKKMTEIRIEHKKKPVWPWVVAVLVALALIAIVIFWQADQPDTDYNTVPDTETVDPAQPNTQPN